VQQVERRHDLGDLGQPQQAGEADDLDGDAGAVERVEDVRGVGVVAGEHADVGPGGASSWAPATASASQASSSAWVSKHAGRDLAAAASGLAPAADRRTRRTAARPAGWRPRGSAVGAAVDGERVGRTGRRRREGVGEVEDVGDRRPAPAVDRLVGVADRVRVPGRGRGAENSRDSIAAWATEVSWYSSSSTTLNSPARARRRRAARGQPGAELDLVGEVHQPEVALEPR
jgi:hypothetical protein